MLIGREDKSVAVRALVEFSAKIGSIDYSFTPSPSGQEGIEGHQKVAARRTDHYQTELSLSIQYKNIRFKGRADGYNPDTHCIEEIKTFYGNIDSIPDNHTQLHWAQVKCYGWMFCKERAIDQISLAIIYFNLTDEQEHRIESRFHIDQLTSECEAWAEVYWRWQNLINARMQSLHSWIEQLKFPFQEMHASQRVMAETVFKAAAMKRVVLAEAPTGTGKTLASLFPAIKSLTRTAVDKIFYLTAKSTGKQLALDAVKLIATDREPLSPLRTLELTALEKICLEPDKECRGDSCTYALGFYDKLPAARVDTNEQTILDKPLLEKIARKHQICPFYLSMEMARWADLVIADINYYFDGTPLLLALTQEFQWKPYLLIDESHNLVERARQMFSAGINRNDLANAKKQAPEKIKKILGRINKHWLELIKTIPPESHEYAVLPHLPEKLLGSLQDFTNHYTTYLQEHPEDALKHPLLRDFFFSALGIQRIFEMINDDFCIDMQAVGSKSELLTLRNLIPAKVLAARLGFAEAAVFFSATLSPAHYFQSMLGLPEDCVSINVPSPFSAEQLDVKIAHRISTRYKDRKQSIPQICELIVKQLQQVPGNALAFFSSYEFLEQVESSLRKSLSPEINLVVQEKRMTEDDRESFIKQFGQQKNLLGLVVLGGAFSEGIDLPGDQLKGAFIATLGLPQINPVNENICRLLQKKFEQGYAFTYTYPGLQKVIQAAGRVIRSENDTGYLWLMDDRYEESHIKNLLPDWWGLV
jgi:DNA excision repair protein ERCC-2